MEEIKSLSQFNKLKASSSLLIIDFYATWCGPCKAISPVFEKLAKQHESSTSIKFAKVDVDKAKDVAQTCGITAMPTFQFFKAGSKADEVKGADVNQLQTKIGYYTAAVAKEGSGQGTKASASTGATSGPVSLRSLIDISTSRLLNTSNLSSVRNIASPPPAGYAIASATGTAQCLIHLSFTQAVTPSQIKITVANDSLSNGPSRIQVGTNVPVRVTKSPDGVESNDLAMESISKAENTQAFNIYSDEYTNGTTELKLKASKFKSVKSLTIRIDANISGEAKTITKVKEMDIISSKA
ncbi:thiol-disulfide exchange intermediate [Mollisia scopiformis]|uniref:Thiol-disulfide exchange intermediate n=1 Tax=Mollisia scopiformis TaxID=149040 RepID=A0A194WZ56_MOLSC|nr:thiol-disulfide exchange intermediate [Mollisia scopiformis]KUJ12877.1 thiol-disulfide exchange intermediate [Mollisia scopiformis]